MPKIVRKYQNQNKQTKRGKKMRQKQYKIE